MFMLSISMQAKKIEKLTQPILFTALAFFLQLPVAGSALAAASTLCSKGVTMNIVAHQDDDLLFQSPDLGNDIVSGRCVRTVYVTAGDAGDNSTYWLSREAGEKAAYAKMSGVSNSWISSDAGISGHPIPVFTLTGKPTVSLAFMRLPDGFPDGSGSMLYGNESLQKLWLGSLATIRTVNVSSSYSKSSLVTTLTTLMSNYKPTQIRVLDHNGGFGANDHSDHVTSANFARAAHLKYSLSHTLSGYQGYGTAYNPVNVFLADLTAKKDAFYAYAAFDKNISCKDDATCLGTGYYEDWLPRQYKVGSESGPKTNIAAQAVAVASSSDAGTGQLATKAIDGIVAGYPVDSSKEWATIGGREGSSLTLSWSKMKSVSRIVLYDRPNLNDFITGASITFSDGSTLNVGALNNNGSGVTVSFPAKSINNLKINILSVSLETANVGLAEVEVF